MSMRTASLKRWAIVLVVVGCLLLLVGTIYLAIPADKLPSILGKVAGSHVPRSKRGIAGVALGVIALAWAWNVMSKVKVRRSRRFATSS